MKKICILLIVCCAIWVSNLNAQISIGPRLGLNFSNLSGSDVEGTSSVTGFHFGGVLNIGINEKFSIQPELLYIQKGAKMKMEMPTGVNLLTGAITYETIESTGKYNYIEIPVLAKYAFVKSDKLEVFANAGPYFGYLMSVTTKVGDESETSSDFGDKDNRLDIGLGLGAGVGLGVGPGKLLGELRYDLGLTSLNSEVTMKNGSFIISFGYLFKLGK